MGLGWAIGLVVEQVHGLKSRGLAQGCHVSRALTMAFVSGLAIVRELVVG